MKYSNYKVDDFLKDDFFVSWAKGEDSHAEKFWEKWLLENPSKFHDVNEARQIINAIEYEEEYSLSDKEYISLYENILKVPKATGKIVTFERQYYYGIAASLVFLIVSWFVINNWKINPVIELSEQTEMITKVVPIGQKLTLHLSDGTEIKLNSNSRLIYPRTFTSEARNVQLEGEAFFDVAKDSTRVFTITSGKLKTRVLGTSFNIKALPKSKDIRVAVSSGKVQIISMNKEGNSKELTLYPDDMGVYLKENNQLEKIPFDKMEELAWKNGVLYFKDNSIDEVISELKKWYGVSFVINKEINTEKDYTGSFDNKSLSQVLKGVSFVFDFDFEIENNTVTIN